MRPAARRALKLALRMHSLTLNPLQAPRTSVALQCTSACTAATIFFPQPVSKTTLVASATDLPLNTLHKARSSAPGIKNLRAALLRWQLEDLAYLA